MTKKQKIKKSLYDINHNTTIALPLGSSVHEERLLPVYHTIAQQTDHYCETK